MDDNLQRVFSILISTIIFFMLPLYIAFEKKDDISYSLALKITSNFVDEVKSKGYLSKEMYDDYISDLALTGNMYDIQMEHIAKKYYPAIYSYTDDTYKKIEDNGTAKFDYGLYKDALTTGTLNEDGTYSNLILSYDLQQEVYTEEQILRLLEGTSDIGITNMYNTDEYKRYTMNVGDEFSVSIKNTNMTTATVLFNSLTFGANSGNLPVVYIDYGCTIENDDYKNNVIDTNTAT